MDVGPVLKILAKPLGVVALGGVIHLLVDRHVKLAKHARPVGVLVQLRKSFGKICDLFENDDVAFDRRLEIWPLHLDGDLLAGVQTGTVDLAERGGGDRFEVKLGVDLVDLAAQLVLDTRKRDVIRKRRNAVDQRTELLYERQRQKVGPRTHRLADLDKRRPELDQFVL